MLITDSDLKIIPILIVTVLFPQISLNEAHRSAARRVIAAKAISSRVNTPVTSPLRKY